MCSPRAFSKNSSRFLAALLLFSTAAFAEGPIDALGLSGSFRGSFWEVDSAKKDQRENWYGSLWLTLRPEEVFGAKFYFDGYFETENPGRSDDSEGVLREAYAEKSLGRLDVRIGRQIIVWGRADKLNPTDNLSVRNRSKRFPDDEDQRLGVLSAQFAYDLDGYRMVGVWLPEWISPTYPMPEERGVTISKVRPKNSQRQFGLKLERSGGGVDWSISYFDGYNKVPDLALLSATSSLVHIGLQHDHIQAFGADFATTLGKFGVRGEAVYLKTSDLGGNDILKQNPYFYAVLGADRNLFENFNLNFQGLYRHVFHYQDTKDAAGTDLFKLALVQSIVTQQQDRDQFGASLKPSWKLRNETLELEATWVVWLSRGDWLLRPKITYALTDRYKLIVGAEVFSGPERSYFGALKKESALYVEVSRLF